MQDWILPGTPNQDDILIIDIYKIQLKNALYTFYHDSCSLDLSVDIENDTFSVGDYLQIDYNLSKATSLNTPIYIRSEDIMMDYTMNIYETGCVLCNNLDGFCSSACSKGLKLRICLRTILKITHIKSQLHRILKILFYLNQTHIYYREM